MNLYISPEYKSEDLIKSSSKFKSFVDILELKIFTQRICISLIT